MAKKIETHVNMVSFRHYQHKEYYGPTQMLASGTSRENAVLCPSKNGHLYEKGCSSHSDTFKNTLHLEGMDEWCLL